MYTGTMTFAPGLGDVVHYLHPSHVSAPATTYLPFTITSIDYMEYPAKPHQLVVSLSSVWMRGKSVVAQHSTGRIRLPRAKVTLGNTRATYRTNGVCNSQPPTDTGDYGNCRFSSRKPGAQRVARAGIETTRTLSCSLRSPHFSRANPGRWFFYLSQLELTRSTCP